jgi:hypothetical protein
MHHTLFSDADAQASLTVAGSGAALQKELGRRLGTAVPRIADPPLMSIGANRGEHALRELAPPARRLALPLTIIFGLAGLALLVLSVALARDRRRGIWGVGLAIAAVGGLAAAGVAGARDVVLTHFDTGFGDAVVSQIWNAYLGDLRTWGLAVGAAGLVIAAAAGGPRLALRAALAAPRTRSGRLVRAIGFVAVAAVAVEVPELLLHVAMVALAAGLVYVAAGDLLRVLAPPEGAARGVRAAATAIALLALIAIAAVPASGTEPPHPVARATAETTPQILEKAAGGAARKTRRVCVTADEARRLAAQGIAMPADARRRRDGRICAKR